LLELLNVVRLLVAEAPVQELLLEQVLAHDLVSAKDLAEVGLLPVPAESRKAPPAPKETTEETLF
jgi:hypothetical protein